jgi:hypothetical protein
MAIQLIVSDSFEIGEEPYVLKDALVLPQAEYDALTIEEIQAMKQARYDSWIAIINMPTDPTDPAV